jgi:hypothetical protein
MQTGHPDPKESINGSTQLEYSQKDEKLNSAQCMLRQSHFRAPAQTHFCIVRGPSPETGPGEWTQDSFQRDLGILLEYSMGFLDPVKTEGS